MPEKNHKILIDGKKITVNSYHNFIIKNKQKF